MTKIHICSREKIEKSLNTVLQHGYSFCDNHFHSTVKSHEVIVKIFPVKRHLCKCQL